VWTGRQAAELGLVDELGGLQDAIDLACVMGGGLNKSTTPIMEYPQAPTIMEAFEDAFGDMAMTGGALAAGRSPLVTSELAAVAAWLAQQPAFAPFVAVIAQQLTDRDPLGADRVQCLMPFAISVR
jgi:ClpP class serine protease